MTNQIPPEKLRKRKKRVGIVGLCGFVLFAYFSFSLLNFSPQWYQRFLDALQYEPSLISKIVCAVYAVCALSLFFPWAAMWYPRSLLSLGLAMTIAIGGVALGIEGLGNDLGDFAGMLFGGFLGILVGGLVAVFLDFDDTQSSHLVVSLAFAVFGLFAISGILGYLHTLWPKGVNLITSFLGMYTLAIGGVLGYAAGTVLSFSLKTERADLAFKYLLCAFLTGASARCVGIAFSHAFGK